MHCEGLDERAELLGREFGRRGGKKCHPYAKSAPMP